MAFGIGSALKRAAKSVGKRIKKNPMTVLDPTIAGQAEGTAAAAEGSKQVVEGVIEPFVPEVPEIPEVGLTAPIPDDEQRRKNRQRGAQRKYAVAGRAGTMLTSDNDKLG